MQMRLHAPALLGGFGRYEVLMVLHVVQRFGDCPTIEIELRGGTFYVPAVRVHVCDELCRCEPTAFEHQLTAP